MFSRNLPKSLSIAAIILLCAACAYSPGTVQRTINYNEALADANNQTLLLNILRASQRLPAYFSHLDSATATSTFTPQIGVTVPLSHSASLADTLPVVGSTSTIARAAYSLAPQLQATETNALALTSLDDQKSIDGMMTPIENTRYLVFERAGWSRELLGMMFIEKINIDSTNLTKVSTNAIATCNERAATSSFFPKLCNSLFYNGNLTDAVSDYSSTGVNRIAECQAVEKDQGFINDPPSAIGTAGGSATSFPNDCFARVFRALLILGLEPNDKPAAPKATIVRKDLPKNLAAQTTFLDMAFKNGLIIVPQTSTTIALCKVDNGGSDASAQANASSTAASGTPPTAKGPTGFRIPGLGQNAGSNESSPEELCATALSPPNPANDSAHSANELALSMEAAGVLPGPAKVTNAKGDEIATLTPRSAEGVIYYLGQIARVELSDRAYDKSLNGHDCGPRLVTLHETAGADCGALALGTPLFRIMQGGLFLNGAVSTVYHGETYYIPPPCHDDGCQTSLEANEFPEHDSLDALTLVEQMWALEKQAPAPPPPAPLTVINP